MATYNLTAGNDVLTGTEGDDTFDGVFNGVTGGNDTLDGGGGNDNFIIGAGLFVNGGSIDGGAGTDSVTLHDERSLGSMAFRRCGRIDSGLRLSIPRTDSI
ncbi:hypothetical protein [Allomesorhizobium camelthorni]|uniref:Calcium-binding protein n=1 Tax=Allomesorhizobium camelthorni TaxID=475069 RepID=A0A6G4WB34_9HYPH|nr:hypothetical protein [Mesorhizobium camelthorni]NGO51446.1 hypothetical protein [Mesorhizobium camelthorni]